MYSKQNYNPSKGQSKCGVYLSRYSDIALKYSESKKWPDHLMVKMVIFKVKHTYFH